MNFINPYNLLGVNPNMPDLKQLKKSYYRLALLCHPDKGGNKHSMDIVHKSYLYIKKQFDNCQNLKSYEELEKEFELFCKTQEAQPPPFRVIWENSEEYNSLKKHKDIHLFLVKTFKKHILRFCCSCGSNLCSILS